MAAKGKKFFWDQRAQLENVLSGVLEKREYAMLTAETGLVGKQMMLR